MDEGRVNDRYTLQVVGIYATKWRYPVEAAPALGIDVSHTRLAAFDKAFRDRLPRLPVPIALHRIARERVALRSPLGEIEVTAAEAYLFVLPSDQVVAALSLSCRTTEVSVDPAPAAEMLDHFTEDDFLLEDKELDELLSSIAPEGTTSFEEMPARQRPRFPRLRFWSTPESKIPPVQLTERHQIVFVPDGTRLSPGAVDRLVYRRAPEYRREFVQRVEPKELNQRGLAGIVTTSVSFIQGHHQLLEGSVFLATVQAVGTLSRFRQIWELAYASVREFRRDKQRDENGLQTRDDLEGLVDLLGNLEFDLTFSVEFPLMRIESYHSALSDVLDLDGQSRRLSNMFSQLGGSIRSEITAIDIRRDRKSDVRRSRNSLAINILAAIGVPLSALLAFFGASTNDIKDNESMFSYHVYPRIYMAAGLLALVPFVVLLVAWTLASGTAWIKRWLHAHQKATQNKGRVSPPTSRGKSSTMDIPAQRRSPSVRLRAIGNHQPPARVTSEP
jgi:hypothetical protein